MARLQIVKKYNRPEHSFMAIITFSVGAEEALNPNIFVVKDALTDVCPPLPGPVPSSSSSAGPLPSSSSSSAAGPPSAPSSSSMIASSASSGFPYPSCWRRRLIAIASLVDLELKPTTPPNPGDMYLASSVVILCRSMRQMEEDLERIVADVRLIAKLQRKPISQFEVVIVEDVPLPNIVYP